MEFNEVLQNRLTRIEAVLGSKEKEYSRGGNRLHNFDIASAMMGCSSEKALQGMWSKHLVSVFDMIENPETVTPELIEEKIGDTINYTILLEFMLHRHIKPDSVTVSGKLSFKFLNICDHCILNSLTCRPKSKSTCGGNIIDCSSFKLSGDTGHPV